ncbi:MAG: hypothetical protein HYY79_12495, partial [Betaproteobacteria bacterium]|nr:hypothetical protein [Betaproteobacteria bacterium]
MEREGAELSKRAPWFSPCDRAVGALLDFLIRVSGARIALELGTSVGHSTAWIARALPSGGKLTTVDRDASMIARARANLGRLGLVGKVVFVQ